MQKPEWFTLIEQWKVRGMGEYGVTLPFLVGALGKPTPELLHEIANTVIPGHVVEVRWCGQLEAPVFSISKCEETEMRFESFTSDANGKISIGFSTDLQSMFGLNCTGPKDCLEKLSAHAGPAIEEQKFSRNRNATGACEWGKYSQSDIQFIKAVLGHEPTET